MFVLFLSPEVWPFTHVGGLSEVARDLPLALGARGHQVAVVTPKGRLTPEMESGLQELDVELEVPVSFTRHHLRVHKQDTGAGVTVYLLSNPELFNREGLYGNAYGDYQDNAERFVLYSRACLELALAMNWQPDVVHCHDWTTGLVPLYMQSLYADHPSLAKAGRVMTVHNLGHQGIFWHYDLPLTGLGWEFFTPDFIEFYGKMNFLKAGLVAADVVTTVSPTYAKDILTPELGFGLEGVLASRGDRLQALINGVDYAVWDPEHDLLIAGNYTAGDLTGKAVCKADLRRSMGLQQDEDRPIVGVMGRMEGRKGLDYLLPAVEQVLDLGYDMVFMGAGSDYFQNLIQEKAAALPGRLAVEIGFSERLAHKLVAGVDLMLIPSRYEPCGLHQMHAMRYGTVPVVRATGGLNDTVLDFGPGDDGNGCKFNEPEAGPMLEALQRTLDLYRQPEKWKALMKRAMATDFSWESVVPRYEELYERALRLRRGLEGD